MATKQVKIPANRVHEVMRFLELLDVDKEQHTPLPMLPKNADVVKGNLGVRISLRPLSFKFW